MKIPKYIIKIIERRSKLAKELNKADNILCLWLEKHNIQISTDDCNGGCIMYCEPDASAKRIIDAITAHDNIANGLSKEMIIGVNYER